MSGSPEISPPRPAQSSILSQTSQCLTDYRRAHLTRALVRQYRLQIVHMANGRILKSDPVAAQNPSALLGDGDRLTRIVELAETYLFGPQDVLIFQSAKVERQQHALAQF